MSVIEREQVEYGAPPVRPPEERKPTKCDLLHRAADLLEEFDWCRVSWGSKAEGRFCAHGALMAATADYGLGFSGDGPYAEAMRAWQQRTGGGVLAWNDAPGRTKTEVIAALREAAEAA